MILSANWRESGRRFFYTHVVFCNQGDNSGVPRYHKCKTLAFIPRCSQEPAGIERALSGTGGHRSSTKPLGITAAPCPAPQPSRHSRSETIQAQGRAVKHISTHFFSQLTSERVPLLVCLASPACQTRTPSQLLLDKTSRSPGHPQRRTRCFSLARCC